MQGSDHKLKKYSHGQFLHRVIPTNHGDPSLSSLWPVDINFECSRRFSMKRLWKVFCFALIPTPCKLLVGHESLTSIPTRQYIIVAILDLQYPCLLPRTAIVSFGSNVVRGKWVGALGRRAFLRTSMWQRRWAALKYSHKWRDVSHMDKLSDVSLQKILYNVLIVLKGVCHGRGAAPA